MSFCVSKGNHLCYRADRLVLQLGHLKSHSCESQIINQEGVYFMNSKRMLVYNNDGGLTDFYNPFSMYAKLRKESPFVYNEDTDIWNVYRYEDVKRALSDYESFSSVPNEKNYSSESFSKTLVRMDPPKHTQLRMILNRSFTPKVIKDWEPRIQEIIEFLLDQVKNQVEIDLVKSFSYPLPMMIISEMLGVPSEHREQFKKWSDDLIVSPKSSAKEDMERAISIRAKADKEISEYFREVINEKKSNIKNLEGKIDILSILIKAEEEGLKLTSEELVAYCILLLFAGNETTTNLISGIAYTFAENKEVLQEVKKNPDLVPGLVEEALRYRSPVQAMSRIVKHDLEIGGIKMKKGQVALAWIGSANRDETVFDRADVFDLHRNPNNHLAFGHGIHFCLGSPLARLEAKLATEAMIKRYSDFSLIEDKPAVPFSPGLALGLESLPIQLSK